MKIIIVGATGFIGGAILKRALASSSVSSIVTLSRRELPSEYSQESKLKNVIVADFTTYPDDVLAEIVGSDACIWALGGRAQQFANYEEARNANVVLLHAGARAMVEHMASATVEGKKFRFVYCSGKFAEPDQAKKLVFMEETRKLKGEAETGLIDIERNSPDRVEVFIGRPAGVLETDKGLANTFIGPMGIGKGELAAALTDIAVNGAASRILENKDLRERAKKVLTTS